MGRNNQHLLPIFTNSIVKSHKLGTKILYAGLCSKYVYYCKQQSEDPIDPENRESLNALAIMYWMAERTYVLGNCNSFDSWSAALSWLCGHMNLPISPRPRHQDNSDFILFRRNLRKAYTMELVLRWIN